MARWSPWPRRSSPSGRRRARYRHERKRQRHRFDFDAFSTGVLVADLARLRAEPLLAVADAYGLDDRETLHWIAGPDRATRDGRPRGQPEPLLHAVARKRSHHPFLGGDGALSAAGAGLLQPLYQGARNRRNYEAAQARFTAAAAGYQKAALNGYREVANALVTIQKLAEIRAEIEAAVTVLQDAADLSRARYESGLASYLEIILADQALFRQQLLLAQTRGSELRARAELYRALGGGWQP